jgi:hypothetical protein
MVFAGLRALEQAGQGRVASPSQYSAESNAIHGGAPTALVGAHHAAPQPDTISAPERSGITTANNASSGSDHGSGATSHDPSAALAAYTTLERSANEDLERSVGSAIDRTLDQALPRVTRPDSAAMKTRLAATIRQDVEKSL